MSSIVLHAGSPLADAARWATLDPAERKRRAVRAANERSFETLWDLTEAFLRLHGTAGANLSPHSVRAYRLSVRQMLAAMPDANLLHLSRDRAAVWVRTMEASGMKPATVQVRLAGARMLYRALRWAIDIDPERPAVGDPFQDIRPARDKRALHDRRKPYADADIAALLAVATGDDRLLVLLAGHAALRVSECVALQWRDVDTVRRVLHVRHGKGGKSADVDLSRTLTVALAEARERSDHNEYVITAYRSTSQARNRMKALCAKAGVRYLAVHSLRHAAGTRMQREKSDLLTTARFLRHNSTSTSEIYIHFANDAVAKTVDDW